VWCTGGEIALVRAGTAEAFATLLKWADKIRRLRVRTNADTPQDARVAREMGAEGIGLVRTEHMFFKDFASIPRGAENASKRFRTMILRGYA